MMSRNLKIVFAVFAVALVIGLLSFRGLHRRIQRLAQAQAAEDQARHEVLATPISTPTDVTLKTTIFWASGPDKIAPVQIELPLSADPVQRSRQVLNALIANPPTPDLRTIPADTTVLGFYVLPDGTAIADFSDALASETPSGIMSEQNTVNSIAQTLKSNVPVLRRLKILIHGQEVDTLAGNVDLTGFFDLNPPVPPPSPAGAGVAPQPGTTTAPAAAPTTAPTVAPAAPAAPASH
jgi:Sporulation and spore germination